MRTTRKARLAIIVGLIVAVSILDHCGVFGHSADDRSRYHDAVATVTYVSDGDTFDIDIADGERAVTRIRLWGVDCPEIAHGPDEHDSWFGREAADFVQEHVEGRRIRIALDPNRNARDRYGRLLAFVYLSDTGEMLNEILAAEGLAYADRRFDHIFSHRFRRAERRAQKSRAGLWDGLSRDRMPGWRRRMMDAGVIRE